MTGVTEKSIKQASTNDSFFNMADLLLLGYAILKLKNCLCIF